MPLSYSKSGEVKKILSLICSLEIKKYLMNLGLIVGENIFVVRNDKNGIILQIKNSKIALNKEIASNILVA